MPLRTILLQVMLWSLAVAAATGVLAVLSLRGALPWRIVGTGLTTAFACALMLPVSALVDREKSRAAGLLGMAGVILEFVMALMLIWEAPRHLLGKSWDDEIALTMVLFGLAALLVMSLTGLQQRPYGFVAARVGMVVTLATFVACLLAIWVPRRFHINEDWWETSGALFVFGGLATVCLVGGGRSDRRSWRWAGIVASIVACAMCLVEIWIGAGTDLGFVMFCAFSSVAAVVGHANLCLMCPLTRDQRWVGGGTIAAAILTACLVDAIIADERLFHYNLDDVLGRLAAAAGIVTGCGTMALCVLARINRKVDFEPLSSELTEMTVVCPRCRKKQPIKVGDSSCVACKLRISIRIEEPRCPKCDYLLYGLVTDRCPECGTPIGTKSEPAALAVGPVRGLAPAALIR
ncbi:MAG: hypothetical protein WBE26_05145 [Phycisphaerae bacterium]